MNARNEASARGGSDGRPIVIVTGAAGNLGMSTARALLPNYRVVGMDRDTVATDFPLLRLDLSSDDSVELAFRKFRDAYGNRIASVIHLIAFFDFTGEPNPLYERVNVEGTRRLLRALQNFDVEQFLYASTILVHAPCKPGERIDERQPIEPRWEYPKSKAAAEAVIREEHGKIRYAILRLAGVYDESTTVPTMAQQMARIYERDLVSHLYPGDPLVGQSMLHREDLMEVLRRAVDRRATLPNGTELLIGEPDPIGYDALQDELGRLFHGADDWLTLRVPKSVAAVGAWAQQRLEPVVPDAIDEGEEPFIKPFMVRMADDHYALDVRRARELLGWEPKRRLQNELPDMVRAVKDDPASWYQRHKIDPPDWIETADALGHDTGDLAARHDASVRRELRANRWAHFANIGLGTWLVTQPALLGVSEPGRSAAEIGLGTALMVFAALALSWRMSWARWVCAGLGALVMAVPFLFWTTSGVAYLSDTLVGALVFGFAVATKPDVGPSPLAALKGPEIPLGWTYNPSTWTQRLPIILFALVGLYVSRYLAAYQLGHVDQVFEPFFAGSAADPRNGTEEIISSAVSEAWPVSDAAVGGYTYALEILTGLIGSRARWRTMPWLVVLFGLMIAPLGIVSILFIIIQPIVIGTWSTLALVAAAAMLVQIPYSLDELLASVQFIRRRARAGGRWLTVAIRGDTDDMPPAGMRRTVDEFDETPAVVLRDAFGGGVSMPWNLAVAALLALSLLFTRLWLGAEGSLANAHHLLGALVLTVISIAAAEVARPARYLNLVLGAALVAVPFMFESTLVSTIASIVAGVAIAGLSLRRGEIRARYGDWSRLVV
jgi:nucleoside-diphosphate-sugar epimerase/disulfide bond formation protein DsbB